ncbi:MAG TPA: DUF732 domain-containing protein [Mycobacterium sp.]|nr:DUF732 domain-containing protein [Mycobacterium sp.]HKP39652.1 DUF732 domain-containing protein [Mycobacterium sp.]
MQHAVRRTVGLAKRPATSLLVASAAALLTGCSVANNVMASVGLPTSETAPAHGQAGAHPPGPPQPGGESNALIVTGQQRVYLDALKAAGIKPSSDLLALSIGSYVCQARAAKQSDQAVWDFVVPLVRNDVRDAKMSSSAPSTGEVNSTTADYIRIATERLC